MNTIEYILLTFDNTHYAISTKKKLDNLIDYRTVPTLREISASCGISLRLDYPLEYIIDLIKTIFLDKNQFKVYIVSENINTHQFNIQLVNLF